MKYIMILTVLMLSCAASVQNTKQEQEIVIIPTDNYVDGRQTFNVRIEGKTAMEYMYAEEIANALITGNWVYNEDLRVK